MTNFSDEKRKLDLKELYIKFSSWKKSSSWRKKGHEPSRAEPNWKYFRLSYGSSQLGSDSSLETSTTILV